MAEPGAVPRLGLEGLQSPLAGPFDLELSAGGLHGDQRRLRLGQRLRLDRLR